MKLQEFHRAALRACQAAIEKQGNEVVLLDLHELPAAADYFVLVTSRSQTHARGLSRAIEQALDDFPLQRRGIEGYPDAPWILLDYYGVVAHIFLAEERDFYNLERLWSKAKLQNFEKGMVERGGIK